MPPPKLLDQVRHIIRLKHFSLRTEQAYVSWIKRFILFNNKRHPAEMGEAEIRKFLSDLAVKRRVAASTQTVALSALLFLYRNVPKQDLPYISKIERAKQPHRLPVVFSRAEVQSILRVAAQFSNKREPLPDKPVASENFLSTPCSCERESPPVKPGASFEFSHSLYRSRFCKTRCRDAGCVRPFNHLAMA